MTLRTTTPLGKEAFFRDLLVPTGQVLEVLLKLAAPQLRHAGHATLAHDAFEPLNLAACYAINPTNIDLDPLAQAVELYVDGMLAAIKAMGPSRAPYVASALGVRHSGSSDKVRTGLRNGLEQFRRQLTPLVQPVYEAIGYDDSQRGAWLNEQTDPATPLTRLGTTNKWRTFVRNTSWQRCVEMLGISSSVPAEKHSKNAFSTAAGAHAAELLWRETFAGEVTAVADNSDASVSEPPATTRLPVGVAVKSTTSGELQVEADFDPRQFLDKLQAKALKAPGRIVSEALHVALAARQFRQTCDVLALVDTAKAAGAWLTEQHQTKEAVLAVYAQWLEEMRLKAVRDKLAQHFNEEERRLLATLFAAEASETAVAA